MTAGATRGKLDPAASRGRTTPGRRTGARLPAGKAGTTMTGDVVRELLARSNALGADRRNTNYAGGNTSAKGTGIDPVTGAEVELLWVKGSGGDLGTLTEATLAVLRMDRLRALAGVYRGPDREDEMVAAFDHCLHGRGGAAPSIDTAMHGLVDAAHVDHLHPDSGIALATAADGEALTREVFGDRVVWMPWRRPGFQLGLDVAAVARDNPQAIGCMLGGHGITAWGDTSARCQARSMEIIRAAEEFIAARTAALAERGRHPFGPVRDGFDALPPVERRARAAAIAPVLRGLASTDRRQVGHVTDSAEVLDFLARDGLQRLAALGTSCPDHFLRTKVRPMVLDLPASAPVDVTDSQAVSAMGGDIVYIASKNSVFAGPNDVAYSAAKADQAHQVRLLAAELGEHGIRVNGVNPDGVVRGSGIFAGGWGAERAAVYGVPESELGLYHARRTLLGREVLPEHVAAAVAALVGGDLCQTTGLHIPVDSGVAAAFLR